MLLRNHINRTFLYTSQTDIYSISDNMYNILYIPQFVVALRTLMQCIMICNSHCARFFFFLYETLRQLCQMSSQHCLQLHEHKNWVRQTHNKTRRSTKDFGSYSLNFCGQRHPIGGRPQCNYHKVAITPNFISSRMDYRTNNESYNLIESLYIRLQI